MKKQYIKISKFLSYILRHKPEAIGLELDKNGWVSIERLVRCANSSGQNLSHEVIEAVVQTNEKKRFAVSDDGLMIRANQGHSVDIDLELKPKLPPKYLYHGTATRFLDSILSFGLKPRERQHVHLSSDIETAVRVGQRHGKSVIVLIRAGKMNADGYPFFLSANGVWLTEKVPLKYLEILDKMGMQPAL